MLNGDFSIKGTQIIQGSYQVYVVFKYTNKKTKIQKLIRSRFLILPFFDPYLLVSLQTGMRTA